MTEEKWLTCHDPTLMLYFLGVGASKRRFMLFICACERRLRNKPECEQEKTEVMERFADGLATVADIVAISKVCGFNDMDVAFVSNRVGEARWAITESLDFAAFVADAALQDRVLNTGRKLNNLEEGLAGKIGVNQEKRVQCDLLRDIFGNIFRPVTFLPSWRTSTVLALATGIYQDRAFDRMPILADALQDAGCDNEDIRNHCRSETVHTRGCFVIDLCLGKQ